MRVELHIAIARVFIGNYWGSKFFRSMFAIEAAPAIR